MLGIIGALDIEVEAIVQAMQVESTCQHGTLTITKGKVGDTELVVCKGIIGKVGAAVSAQILIDIYGVDAIVNTGVAGALSSDIKQCDMVVATGFVQHDVDTSPLGDPVGFISCLEMVEFPSDEKLTTALVNAAENKETNVYTGLIATGDQFIAGREQSNRIINQFGASACDMEGGAIAQVCTMAGIPFAAIRCISDNADQDASMSFEQFKRVAAHACAQAVLRAFCY